MKRLTTFAFGVSLFALVSALLYAQSGSSTRDGVYTSAQADQGHALYTKQCAMCHGATLAGSGQNPPLSGDAFMQNWEGQTLADLYGKIQATMPATVPGSLKPDEVTQVIAY
ncbi:MAG: c-type cytochrome, partial [Acidobacteriota bacterium]